jgi:hypothetical protein
MRHKTQTRHNPPRGPLPQPAAAERKAITQLIVVADNGDLASLPTVGRGSPRGICCQSKWPLMATATKASTRSAARSLRISVVIYPAQTRPGPTQRKTLPGCGCRARSGS